MGKASKKKASAQIRLHKSPLFWLAIVFFAVTRWTLLGSYEYLTRNTDVLRFYDRALQAKMGKVPYRDIEMEYPPIAWWLIAWPSHFDLREEAAGDFFPMRYYGTFRNQLSGLAPDQNIDPISGATRPMDQVTRLRFTHLLIYYHRFRTQMAMFDLAAFVAFLFVLAHRKRSWLEGGALGYAGVTALLAPVLYDRMDVALLFLLMVWGALWVRSRNKPFDPINLAAYLVLGLGIALKLIPGIVLPFVLLADFVRGGGYKSLAARTGVVLAVAVAPFVPAYAEAGGAVFQFVRYHGARGIEVESIYSFIIIPLKWMGLEVKTAETFHSLNLESSVSGFLATASAILLLAFLGALFAWTWRQRKSLDPTLGWRLACFAIIGSVIFSKVFSPQYLVWAAPLILLLGAEVLKWRTGILLVALLLVVAGATTWIFPYNFVSHVPFTVPIEQAMLVNPNGLVPALSPIAVAVLFLRNSIYVGVTVWLGWRAYRSSFRPGLRGR